LIFDNITSHRAIDVWDHIISRVNLYSISDIISPTSLSTVLPSVVFCTTMAYNINAICDLPEAFSILLQGKANAGLTFEQIAQAMNKDEVWVTALFYGQAKASEDELRALCNVLHFHSSSANAKWTPEWLISQLGPHWYPNRGIGPIPPTDPVIYRLFEGVLVYGHAIKAVIHEKFGDGIMSMIDCKIHVDKKEDPNGNRVLLTFDGKFLPYAKW